MPTEPRLAWMDTFGRLGVAALLLYHVTIRGASPVLLVFLLAELTGAAFQYRQLAGGARRGDGQP